MTRGEVWWGWHRPHVVLFTEGTCNFRIRGDAGDADFVARPGRICIFPSGFDKTRFLVSRCDLKSCVAELDTANLKRLLCDDGLAADGALIPQIDIDNPHIVALLGSMRAEIEAGCPAGSLYGQSLSLTLAAYLAGRYSTKGRRAVRPVCKFSAAQRRQVLEYIHAQLGSDFSLIELSNAMQLSPRHFSRLFRNTFGTTPYQYVRSERVIRAKVLLGSERVSIVEIAHSLGFANQSHFTDVFRKATGVPPRRFQQEHRRVVVGRRHDSRGAIRLNEKTPAQ